MSAAALLPITSTFALPLSIYHIFLQVRVSFKRIASRTSLEASSKPQSEKNDDPLLAAFRAQSNFTENVPLALILAGAVELNGGSKTVLTAALSALVVFRIAHAEYGLMAKGYGGKGRPIGFFGTAGVIVGLAAYGAWLARGN
ncbi:uncharacterized protein LTR77_008369 [Saxophila tyrrhenica]|uniref:Glutathione transferase n=1 Tax=Saxophila tyrrhenica TaxID=1690608 RepID=A0AAV9P4V2_9PEZI|nr:hypothetical protein LTR77_008369 [Saxophila tyrrhenica]